jgi:hypothetical protein
VCVRACMVVCVRVCVHGCVCDNFLFDALSSNRGSSMPIREVSPEKFHYRGRQIISGFTSPKPG